MVWQMLHDMVSHVMRFVDHAGAEGMPDMGGAGGMPDMGGQSAGGAGPKIEEVD